MDKKPWPGCINQLKISSYEQPFPLFCEFTHADYGALRQGKLTAKISRKRVSENPSEHENGSLKPDDAPVKNLLLCQFLGYPVLPGSFVQSFQLKAWLNV